jgi:hypothetical protein
MILGGCISYTKDTSTEKAVPVVAAAPSNRVEAKAPAARAWSYWPPRWM